ncbi:MAG: HNH endonuclease [Bacteroidota bacterium]|nr:HNH endonuclease [Bacteroidota bacterium]
MNPEPLCELCDRTVQSTRRHHLTPLQKGGKHTPTVNLCQPCHATIHSLFTNTELAREFNTVPQLKEAERLESYLKWIRNKTLETIPVKGKKR